MAFIPIIEGYLKKENYQPINLSAERLVKLKLNASAIEDLQTYLTFQQEKFAHQILYGGYLEKRNLYDGKALFSADEIRNIHLGVDFWEKAGTGIYCPRDGEIVVSHYNSAPGNYGGTLILKHQKSEGYFYSLYGHLSKISLRSNPLGKKIKQGEVFCWLGETHENGGYIPHLHFQLINDFDESLTDYAGVCSSSQVSAYQKNCPNPELFLGICNS